MLDGVSRTLALVGGAESMSRVQLGLRQAFRTGSAGFPGAHARPAVRRTSTDLKLGDIRLLHSRGRPTARPARAWASTPRSRRRMEDRARRAGPRSRWRATSVPSPPMEARLLRRPRDPRGRRQARHDPARRHLARAAGEADARVRSHQRPGHADGGQLLAADRRRGGHLGRDDAGLAKLPAERAAGEAGRLRDHRRSTSATRAC